MEKDCFSCKNCLYICEGDYMCEITHQIVRVNHSEPTSYFMVCKKENKQNSNIKTKEVYLSNKIRNGINCISEMNDKEIKVNSNYIRNICKATYNLICSQSKTIKQLKYNNRKRKTNNKINKDLREKLGYLLSTYEFKQEVLNDIRSRLMDYFISSGNDNGFNNYLSQQIRYLENILVSQGISVDYKTNNKNKEKD